jgi:hypothetical protein
MAAAEERDRRRRLEADLRSAAHNLLAALPASRRSRLFGDLHAGLRHVLLMLAASPPPPGSRDERSRAAAGEAVLVLAQLYALAGDGAPAASDWRRRDDESARLEARGRPEDDDAGESGSLLGALLKFYEETTTPGGGGGEPRPPAADGDGASGALLLREAAMAIVARLVWTDLPPSPRDGGDDEGGGDEEEEALFPVLRSLQSHPTAWRDFVRLQDLRDENWRQALVQRYCRLPDRGEDQYNEEYDAPVVDEDQRAYLESLLLPAEDGADRRRQTDPRLLLQPLPDDPRRRLDDRASPQRPAPGGRSEVDRRIQQVRDVLPHLGEGFVEAVLSYYRGDVERTLDALVQEGSLPESLERMDRSLPRRTRRGAAASTAAQQDDGEDPEALEATRSLIRAIDLQHEADADAVDRVLQREESEASPFVSAKDEYDDDHDDQYDELEPAADAGADDYDTIMAYNRVLRSVEREGEFWEGERNANRGGGVGADDPTPQRPYRGPDKLKGGRVPHPSNSRGRRGGGGEGRSGRSGGRHGGGGVNDQGSSEAGGRGDRPRAPAGGGGRGSGPRGGGAGRRDASGPAASAAADPAPAPGNRPRSSRAKASTLAHRREKQKQAAAKRIG